MVKVIQAQLHDVLFVPTLGQLDASLPPKTKVIKGFEMFRLGNGDILLKFQDKFGKPGQAVINGATVKISVIDPEAKFE